MNPLELLKAIDESTKGTWIITLVHLGFIIYAVRTIYQAI